MKTLFNNQLLTIELNEEKKCLYHHWKKSTENASWNEIKDGFMLFFQAVSQSKPKYLVVDERENFHPFTPDEQKWIDENTPKMTGGVQIERMAVVISKNGFVELASETMMEDGNAKNIKARFFPTLESAEKWILG